MVAMTARPQPRPSLYTPPAAVLRTVRVALAGMREGVWTLDTRAANDGGERGRR